jgi:DNA-binding transcriptional LysR family regulator
MPSLAAMIIRRHPRLQLTVMAESAVELLRGVKSGAFDLVVLANGPVEGEKDLIAFDVMDEPGVAVACPGHPLAGRSKISIAEFAEHDLIGTATSSTSTPLLYAMPEISQMRYAKRPFRPRIVTSDLDTTMELVRQGLAIYAGPEHIVRPSLDLGSVVRLDVDWSFTYRAVAAMTPAASLSPLLRQIVGYAQEVGAEMLSRNAVTAAPRRVVEPA